jgi:hypothetical protein
MMSGTGVTTTPLLEGGHSARHDVLRNSPAHDKRLHSRAILPRPAVWPIGMSRAVHAEFIAPLADVCPAPLRRISVIRFAG